MITTSAWLALVVAGVAALVDWWSVGRDRSDIEVVAKPAVMVALIAAAAALSPADPAIRTAVVVGLTCGLVGDVLLFFDQFIGGAAAFLVGHVAYVVAFLMAPQKLPFLIGGALLLGVLVGVVAGPIVAGARKRSGLLGGVVVCYLIALGAVLVFGVGTANPWVVAGVILFSISDALLAYGRFVGPAPGGRVAVHVTYHLAQALLVVSLVTLA